MAGSVPPPLVSSSPPPLSAFDDDDDDDDDDDEFGIFTVAEDIEFTDVSYKVDDKKNQTNHKVGGEQDSTSQDSVTDSGLCPDSEGVSSSPHSDDEKIAKLKVCGDELQNSSIQSKSLSHCFHSDTLQDNLEYSDLNTFNSHNICLDCEEHASCSKDAVENAPSIESASLNIGIDTDKDVSTFLEISKHSNVEAISTERLVITNCEDLTLEKVTKNSQDIQYDDEHNQSNEQEDVVLNTLRCNVSANKVSELVDSETEIFETEDHLSTSTTNLESERDTSSGETLPTDLKEDTDIFEREDHSSKSKINLEIDSNPSSGEKLSTDIKEDIDEFDDFCDFQTTVFSNPTEHTSSLNGPDQGQQDVLQNGPTDFAQVQTEKLNSLSQDESDEEFSNFADFSSSDCVFVSTVSSFANGESVKVAPSDTELRTESVFQNWESVFPAVPCESLAPLEEALVSDRDAVWSRLLPLDATPALSHQWTNSWAYRRLLTSLNIDSRNILLMPWSNSGIPRFAATLSGGPLEPVKAVEPLQPASAPLATGPSISHPQNQEMVPDAHFDWVSSGLTNPLDYKSPVLNVHKTLSVEAEQILSSLPDLSFMRRTYIDFPINNG